MEAAYKIGLFGWMLSWLWVEPLKHHFYVKLCGNYSNPLYPTPMRSPTLAYALWALPGISGVWAMVAFSPTVGLAHGVILAACAVLLLAHQAGHGIPALATGFWIACWFAWVGLHAESSGGVARRGAELALLIVAFVYFAGFIGKVTPRYWSGKAFAYFRIPREENKLAYWMGSKSFSRLAMVGEGAAAMAWFLPTNAGLLLCTAVLLGQWAGTWIRVLDAIGPLLGLSLAGLYLLNFA